MGQNYCIVSDTYDNLPLNEPLLGSSLRKGGRVVEGTGLENQRPGYGSGGSNPFPSATIFLENLVFLS